MTTVRGLFHFLQILTTPLVVAALTLVHCLGSASADRTAAQEPKHPSAKVKNEAIAKGSAVILRSDANLPRPVDEMREAILAAVASGRIEDLREAFELNEIKPDLGAGFGPGNETDPVAFWRRISADGQGRELLAALANILALAPAAVPLGKDVENNKVYVWPYLAEVPVAGWTPAQEVDALRLVSVDELRRMRAGGTYTFWRLAIGAEGTWLSLTRK